MELPCYSLGTVNKIRNLLSSRSKIEVVFITASDYFALRFTSSGYETTFQNHFSAWFNCSNLISLALLMLYKRPVRIEIPLWINLVTFLFFAVSVIMPISPTTYFWITIGFIAVTGTTTSVLQSSVVAEASQLVPKYMQAVMR
jgi:equilibrative nucleoside transporter 1/2/3